MTESTPRKMLAIGQQHGIEAKLLSPDEVWISYFFSLKITQSHLR